MKKSNSISMNLENFQIIKYNSFNDFHELELKGSVKYLSYGQFLAIKKETTKDERRRAIKNHYYNCK